MKILVWQTAFLGDLILTTPLVHSIKNIYPNSELHLIAKPFGRDIFKNNPFLNKLIIFDKNKQSTLNLIKELRKEKYDIAISPHRSHRASYSIFLSGIKKRIGFDKAGFSFLYTDLVEHRFDGTHEIDRNLKLLTKLEDYSENKLFRYPEIFLTKEEEDFYKRFSLEKKNYILVAPGSKWATKRWTVEGFRNLIQYLQNRNEVVVLFGGNEDIEYTNEILEDISSKNIINLVGKTNLRESFSIVKNAKLLVSNDSAPVHMAVAFNTPVVDIYGPTVKEFGFYPYRNGVVVELNDLSCRPCGLHGHNKCPEGHFKCMKDLKADFVIKEVEKFIS
jgi:heptosyltransferase-2